MKKLRNLGAAVVLMFVLALCAFAGETPTPPCADPAPGQIPTPPCSAAPGDMDTPGVTATTLGDTTVANGDTSFTEIATDVVLNILSLY
jgi:hypothetical protein